MKLEGTKEYKELLSVLGNIKNEGLRTVIEDAIWEVIADAEKASWAIGYDAGYTNGERAGKKEQNA